MNAITADITVSPVNMEDRQGLGIKPGDTVRVHQKIQERGKTRIQVFEGLVLARKHGNEPGATFTVRKVVDGVGVERIFPLYSPLIDKIEIVRRSKVRRAKLYHIRNKVAREIKRQMRRMKLTSIATESEMEAEARAAEEAKRAEEAAQEAEAKEADAAEATETQTEPTEQATEGTSDEMPTEEATEEETQQDDSAPEEEAQESGGEASPESDEEQK